MGLYSIAYFHYIAVISCCQCAGMCCRGVGREHMQLNRHLHFMSADCRSGHRRTLLVIPFADDDIECLAAVMAVAVCDFGKPVTFYVGLIINCYLCIQIVTIRDREAVLAAVKLHVILSRIGCTYQDFV